MLLHPPSTRHVGPIRHPEKAAEEEPRLLSYIQLKLAALGHPLAASGETEAFGEVVRPLLANLLQKDRLLSDYLCPTDQRIQSWLDRYLAATTVAGKVRLPNRTFVLDRHGLARLLSIPPDKDFYQSPILSSYRLKQGVLHNPKSDRRTTAGVFHVAEGGLPIPADKLAVPTETFGRMLQIALQPPSDLLVLPFTGTQKKPVETFVSLLLRPVVCPEVPGVSQEKSLEVRFFVPGSLVANLDFVESIFGNAGDPYLPENDAALDVARWTGHSGCVILAPHMVGISKKTLGLPHFDQATERQRREGMCWKTADEPYNGGSAFKLCARDASGVVVTLIADNYFGYCKKEVKTQIGFSANLFGNAEEEHAGGTVAFQSYDLGEEFAWDDHIPHPARTMEDVSAVLAHDALYQPEGHAFDKNFRDIVYVPADTHFNIETQRATWTHEGVKQSLHLRPECIYVYPWGYQVQMHKPAHNRAWRLIGTVAEGTLCHKPCTVSGGGKSEISKSIADAILHGPVFISDFEKDFDAVEALVNRDYHDRFKPGHEKPGPSRSILSRERSLGSVIKLFTPQPEYTDEYNKWLKSIPLHIKELLFVVKRFYRTEWGNDWRSHFAVDRVNGAPGNELKLGRRKLLSQYLRVGYEDDGSWRVFGLRKDFHPSAKVQMEDDITASVVVPADRVAHLAPAHQCMNGHSVKFVHNCEYRLFQRPDDAIHRGYDHTAETDFSRPFSFFSNYEPLTRKDARELIADAIGFEQFTDPMRRTIEEFAAAKSPDYFVSTHQPRIIEGKASKNPRYLQTRPDLLIPQRVYMSMVGTRLARRIPSGQPVPFTVDAVLAGRRNNPPERSPKVPALALHNPIHYLELPELLVEVICSMTGKSPSTTGAGSEGALTKGPFNCLRAIHDLNAFFVSAALTGSHNFITSAGCVGPKFRVDHDISLLVPEIWARMAVKERDPAYLKASRMLEACGDLEIAGLSPAQKSVLPLLGWRVTRKFVNAFFGRVFNNPELIFDEAMLKPELQDLEIFKEGLDTIAATVKYVSAFYFDDKSVDVALPPLRALLEIMRDGRSREGWSLQSPEFRALFSREAVLGSTWYAARLASKQQHDIASVERNIAALEKFIASGAFAGETERLGLQERLENARQVLGNIRGEAYLRSLRGMIGRDPGLDVKA